MANGTTQAPTHRALRITAITIGSLLILLSLAVWFPYLTGSLANPWRPEPDHGASNNDIIWAFFGFWLLIWTPGIVLTIVGTAGWRKRWTYGFIVLAVVMLVISGATYVVGRATGGSLL